MGWTSDKFPPRGIFGIEVPKHEGIYTTIHPDYITKVVKEAVKRRNVALLSDIQIQSVLALCNEYLEFYDKLRRGKIELATEFSHTKLEEAAKWAKKTAEILSPGLTYKCITGRYKKQPMSESDKIEIAKKWNMFRDKGMVALKPRFRKTDDKVKALQKLQEENFNVELDNIELNRIVSELHKKKPILKAIFGYLIGIKKDSKRRIHPISMVDRVNYLLSKISASTN